MFRKLLMAAGGILIMLGVTTVLAADPVPFNEPFNGTPAAPESFNSETWDVQVHSRNKDTWFQLEPVNAQHDANCSAPPSSHVNTSYEGSVYICNNHIMTSLNASGYGVIYLTPNKIFDFSNGGSLTFDISTERMSIRDWWDVLITPYEDNLSLPLFSNLSQGTDLYGSPVNLIHIGTDNGDGAPKISTVINSNEWNWPDWVSSANEGISSSVNQAVTRQTFKFTIADGRMKFERLASNTAPALVFWDVAATVPFTSGIVQFGHHSYTPEKDSSGAPGTWHWDNITFSNSIPFNMIKADRRYTQGGTVNFNTPAPANAYLRFSAVCKVLINGNVVSRANTYDRWGMSLNIGHMSSYFVPIQEGTQSVNISFADDDWYTTNLGCIAKDFSIWSLSTSVPPSTSTPLPTTAATNTPIATATSTSTATPSPVPPTATPIPPTATPTPARCRVQVRNLSNTGWTYSIARGSYEGTLVNGECRR